MIDAAAFSDLHAKLQTAFVPIGIHNPPKVSQDRCQVKKQSRNLLAFRLVVFSAKHIQHWYRATTGHD